MMRYNLVKISAILTLAVLFSTSACAYWIWTPETKKFVNPKYAVKDSPKEQFDWAMSFYDTKDYQRAATEFEKLTKHYEYSEYASKAQYYVGLSYENMSKFYIAFQNYQKAIDNFPHIENMDEIIAREFNIGNIYASKGNPRVLGADIMTSLERAVEIYGKVVDNAPYGRLADEAQYNMADCLKRSERYDEAIQAFQKVVNDYPTSRFAEKARFESADSAYRASLKPAYDIEPTDKAIKAFEEFSQAVRDDRLSIEAEKTVQRLKDKAAEKSLVTARFYESQKHYVSAIIYYQDIVNRFPDSSFVKEARAKIEELRQKTENPPAKAGPVSWGSLFSREKPPKPKQAAKAKVKSEAAAKETAKKGWRLFGLGKEKKPKPEAKEAKPKTWAPLKFDKEKKVAPKKETKKSKAVDWNIFGFGKKSKPKETPAVQVQEAKPETPQAQPLQEPVTAESKAETPQVQPAQEPVREAGSVAEETKTQEATIEVNVVKPEAAKKAWAPLKFSEGQKKPKPEAKEAKPKTWAPLKFDKEKKVAPKKEAKKSKAVDWNIFGFGKRSKPQENEENLDAEATKGKGWTPLRFDKK